VGKRRAKDAVLFVVKRLMEGPAYPRDLQRDFGFSCGTMRYHLNRLVKYELAKQLKDKRYAFIDYMDGQELVVEAVKHWKSLAFRYPTVEEIANETGIVPEEAKILAYKTKKETGWSMPNEGVIESAREKLGEILVCAARIRDLGLSKLKENFSYEEDVEIMEKADAFLKKRPELLPKLSENGMQVIVWPPEALKYLGKDYRPKDRCSPSLRAAFKFG